MIGVFKLSKHFPAKSGELIAVDRLSFSVPQGEVFGLLGPNGAGKTTTLRMIMGLLPPTSGYAAVDGFRVTSSTDEVKMRIGFVSASAGLYQWLTPREMLLFFADVYGREPEEAERQLQRVSQLLEMDRFLDQRCATLSTGQQQRVNLARGMIHDPPIMLLDEPTRGLDVVASQVVFDYVELLRDLGKSVIVSTHRLDQAERLCDRFGLLHHGKLVLHGTLSQLQRTTGRQTLTDMFLDLIRENPSEQQSNSVSPQLGAEEVADE